MKHLLKLCRFFLTSILDFEALFELIHANLGLSYLMQIEDDKKLHILSYPEVHPVPLSRSASLKRVTKHGKQRLLTVSKFAPTELIYLK